MEPCPITARRFDHRLVQTDTIVAERGTTLSGGQKQRVGIARALAVRPAVLLMDEPLSALDAQTRDLLLDDIERLLGGTTVVWVTHNLAEAARIADRVVVLGRRPGRVRAVLAPKPQESGSR